MVTFLTFYLGLVVGMREFEISAAENTARVEILLNGEMRQELTVPPWRFRVDLGKDPVPHELTAIAYDADGQVLGQAFQRLNVPRPPVEVAIALESEGGQVRAARLAWEAAADEALTGVRVRLDGRRIPVDDPKHIPLPALDMGVHHHLSAEVTFRGRLRTQAAVVFGGSFVDQVDTELTAVVIEKVGAEDDSVPTVDTVAGWFHRAGVPLSVFAVERPPAEVMMVRDKTSAKRLSRVAGVVGGSSPGQHSLSGNLGRMLERRTRDLGVGLDEDDWFRVMASQPRRREETGKAYFEPTGDLLEVAGGLGMGAAGLYIPTDGRPERLADAVAAAALEVAGGGRRRLVLLVTDPRTPDRSSLTPQQAMRYLEAVQVPLAVWTAAKADEVSEVWGSGVNVNRPGRMSTAVEAVKQRLDRQLVVWLDGRLLPNEVELTEEGLRHVAFPSVTRVSEP